MEETEVGGDVAEEGVFAKEAFLCKVYHLSKNIMPFFSVGSWLFSSYHSRFKLTLFLVIADAV